MVRIEWILDLSRREQTRFADGWGVEREGRQESGVALEPLQNGADTYQEGRCCEKSHLGW